MITILAVISMLLMFYSIIVTLAISEQLKKFEVLKRRLTKELILKSDSQSKRILDIINEDKE